MSSLKFKAVAWLVWLGCTLLLPAQLGAQGAVRFANFGFGVDAPFFGSSGTNRLAGSNYVAALFVAPVGTPNLAQVSPPQRFQEGANAGYWTPIIVTLPAFPQGGVIRAQVRFWDQSRLPTGDFDAAEAAGAEIGVAEIPELTLNTDTTPTPLFELQSASLIPTLTLSRGIPRIATDPAIGATGSQLPQLCNVPVGTNRWFRLTSPIDATAVLNTDGSAIDTVMGAFSGSIVNVSSLVPLACNDDRAPGVTTSAFTLPVEANRLYLICVAGKNAANGPVNLNYTAGVWLQIRRALTGQGLELVWPADGGDYALETSTQPLLPFSWRPVEDDPLYIDSKYIMPIVPSAPQNSYRLRSLR